MSKATSTQTVRKMRCMARNMKSVNIWPIVLTSPMPEGNRMPMMKTGRMVTSDSNNTVVFGMANRAFFWIPHWSLSNAQKPPPVS